MTENKNSSQSQMASSQTGSAPKRRRRRRRSNKSVTAAKASQSGQQQSSPQQSKSKSRNLAENKNKPVRSDNRPHNKKKSHNQRNNRKKPLKAHEVAEKYDYLMEQHLLARKKYFENFHKKDKRRVEKLERSFHRTAMDVRAFERKLSPNHREILELKTNGYPLDLAYSSNNPNSEDVLQIEIPAPPYAEPHLNAKQKARQSYSHDTEATKGTMDEYESYKAEQSAL